MLSISEYTNELKSNWKKWLPFVLYEATNDNNVLSIIKYIDYEYYGLLTPNHYYRYVVEDDCTLVMIDIDVYNYKYDRLLFELLRKLSYDLYKLLLQDVNLKLPTDYLELEPILDTTWGRTDKILSWKVVHI